MEISDAFTWDDPNAPALFARLKGIGLKLTDLPEILGVAWEDVRARLDEYPELERAYELGPEYIKRRIIADRINRAMEGNITAQDYVLKNFDNINDDSDMAFAFAELDKASNAKDISLALRKPTVKSLLNSIRANAVSPSDLIKLLGLIHDRIDGKVADKLEVEMTTSEEAIGALRELVKAGTITVEAAMAEAEILGIKDMGKVIEV